VTTTLRPYRPTDLDTIADLSLRAWEDAFTSWRAILGERLYGLAYPDWRRSQEAEVRGACEKHPATTVVAERAGRVVGFATAVIGEPPAEGARAGDLEIIAVDPDAQGEGVGRLLVDAALQLLRDAGCAYANVWTGGDPGHDAARALYESSGFTALPVVHYYREL
jgi:GNAT superfamily N-acetyltransferase